MGFAMSVTITVATETLHIILDATHGWWLDKTGRWPNDKRGIMARSLDGQQGNIIVNFNDQNILTNRDVQWSDGMIDSCNTETGVASVQWKGMEAAGTMVNVTNLCGGKKKKRDVAVIGDWLDGEVDGAFEGVVPSGIGSQTSIKGSYTLVRHSLAKRGLLALKPGEVLVTVRPS